MTDGRPSEAVKVSRASSLGVQQSTVWATNARVATISSNSVTSFTVASFNIFCLSRSCAWIFRSTDDSWHKLSAPVDPLLFTQNCGLRFTFEMWSKMCTLLLEVLTAQHSLEKLLSIEKRSTWTTPSVQLAHTKYTTRDHQKTRALCWATHWAIATKLEA